MEIICSNCQEELSFSGGVFCCPVCGRDWSEILLDGNKYYDSAIEREYNSIIAYEYAIFKDLIKNKQIYGLLFQVKDVYEVITRIPVLITASFFFNNPALRNDGVNDFFRFLMSKPLSFGDWRAALSKASALLRSCNQIDKNILNLTEAVKGFVNSNKHGDIVFWRNDTIAHGALKLMNDRSLYEDVATHISAITEFLQNKKEYFTEIEFITKEGDILEGSNLDFSTLNGDLFLRINSTKIVYKTSPFFKVNLEGIFFFDRHIAKYSKTDIIEYLRSKKESIIIPEFNNLFCDLIDETSHSVEAQSYSIEERALCESIFDRIKYFEPKFITNWLNDSIQSGEKLLLLQMEAGMGKSTFIRALDPFSLNEIEIEGVAPRAFYINSTYNSRVDDFSVAVSDILRRVSPGFTAANNLKELNVNADNPKTEFASVLNSFKKYHYPDKTLLFIFDGLDEIAVKKGRNISDFIPDEDMLDDGVVVLVTSRTERINDAVNPFILNILHSFKGKRLLLTSDMPVYKDFAYKFFVEKVMGEVNRIVIRKKLKDFVFSDEYLKRYFDNLPEKNILFLTLLKEILTVRLSGIDSISKYKPENVLELNENIYIQYFENIRNVIGERYYKKFINVLNPLALSSRALSIYELAYLSGNEAPCFAFLGFINNIKIFLSTKRSFDGTVFELAHLEQKKAIKKYFEKENEEYLENMIGQIESVANSNDILDGVEYSTFALTESVFALLEKKGETSRAKDLFKLLLQIPFKATWAKTRDEALRENALIQTIDEFYIKNESDFSDKTRIRIAYLFTIMGLNAMISNVFGICVFYFEKAIKIFKKYYELLNDEELYQYDNALTYYATYALKVNENEKALDLYETSMNIVRKLYEEKSSYASLEYYLSEHVCLSNVYRECGRYSEVVKILDMVISRLPECSDKIRAPRLKAFTYLCRGIISSRLNNYKEAVVLYQKAIKAYEICFDSDVPFFIPDAVGAFYRKMENLALCGDKEGALSAKAEMEEYIRGMQDKNKLNNHECEMNVLLAESNSFKALGMLNELKETVEKANNLFLHSLTREEKENVIFINILKEINDCLK
ncbi:MAG: hypothetical protein J6Y68_00520 [Clostridia bacterium]|nr:hypothetical protein [Clostridia bacterium]